jgi:hypothetical protein
LQSGLAAAILGAHVTATGRSADADFLVVD